MIFGIQSHRKVRACVLRQLATNSRTHKIQSSEG